MLFCAVSVLYLSIVVFVVMAVWGCWTLFLYTVYRGPCHGRKSLKAWLKARQG